MIKKGTKSVSLVVFEIVSISFFEGCQNDEKRHDKCILCFEKQPKKQNGGGESLGYILRSEAGVSHSQQDVGIQMKPFSLE